MIATAVRWLAADTFRQARAGRISWLMLAVSGLCIALCLSVRISGAGATRPPGEIELVGADDRPLTEANPRPGRLSIGFGAVELGLFRDDQAEVHFLQVLLAKWVAGAAGTLLALIWTAGFLPEFLQPSHAAILLAKPVPRWTLLLGKYLGTILFVAAQAGVFVVGTWLALGARTGVWSSGYLLCLPLLVIHFAIVYAASTLLAVCTRNTTACAFGAIAFWALCFAMNQGRHAAVVQARASTASVSVSPVSRTMTEAAYWFLPKPADLVILLDRELRTTDHFGTSSVFEAVQETDAFHPYWSLATSALFAAALLAIAAREFALTDY